LSPGRKERGGRTCHRGGGPEASNHAAFILRHFAPHRNVGFVAAPVCAASRPLPTASSVSCTGRHASIFSAWFILVVFRVTRLQLALQFGQRGFGQIAAPYLAKPPEDATATMIGICAGVFRTKGEFGQIVRALAKPPRPNAAVVLGRQPPRQSGLFSPANLATTAFDLLFLHSLLNGHSLSMVSP
jgi:hypothetical protein